MLRVSALALQIPIRLSGEVDPALGCIGHDVRSSAGERKLRTLVVQKRSYLGVGEKHHTVLLACASFVGETFKELGASVDAKLHVGASARLQLE